MQEVKEKKQTKKGKKAMIIVVSVLAAIAVIAAAFITVTTLPVDENSEKVIYVGGMVKSDNISYKDPSTKGLEKNAVVKTMQMIWRFCDGGDKAKHAKQTPPTGITEVHDIAYIDDANHYHKLDVFYPSNIDTFDKLPVIIDIHGGGWMYADKDLNDYYCMGLAERGYVVFNVSYRLVPDVTVNEQIQDCMAALKYISENMINYPCDASNVTLTGDSAGGQLSAYCTVISQSEELQKVFKVENPNLTINKLLLTSPVSFMKSGGAFSIYTKYMWGKDYKTKDTYKYMDLSEIIEFADTMPKTYLITSSGDSLANAQTHQAYELLKEKGFEAEMIDVDKETYNQSLPHVFSVLFPFDDAAKETIDKALDYLNN